MINDQLHSTLRRNVSYLGRVLGETISAAAGPEFLNKIEQIRQLSKSARGGKVADEKRLQEVLLDLRQEELLPVARAFSQFLNLANIADQHHGISREMESLTSASHTLASVFSLLQSKGNSAADIVGAVNKLDIELVLTAHPTEITRRTLIHKHREIDACLAGAELEGLSERERVDIDRRLRELVAQIWHTHDFRCHRPTPVEEAKWGFAVVENSLWHAVPRFVRRLDRALSDETGRTLPLEAAPVRFSSWIGGDRDGNPNVTADVTKEVLLLGRWQAADLYLRDVEELVEELSMTACSAELTALAGETREPYRVILRRLRDRLRNLRTALTIELKGERAERSHMEFSQDNLWQPLKLCYQSLVEQGMATIGNGKLLDLLRRVTCFGIHLVRLDIRQHADRHREVLSELTKYLELGDYGEWDEERKIGFLVAELTSRRPLIPPHWQPEAEAAEVLKTFEVIARQPAGALACYVISMAREASDVLAVELLLKAHGIEERIPVVPLFETLQDLDNAREVVARLLAIPEYKASLAGRMIIMIGYSDSAKDAGMLAAGWAQYRAQESLLDECRRQGISLRLFHGRGGTIGRGGAPAHAALLSQPPGSLAEGLRVTEQGEMIRTKLGLTGLAIRTLALYTSAILQANLDQPPEPSPEWRDIMDTLANSSCRHYRALVRDNPDFVDYFRQATPEQELARLPLGSRPAYRKKGGGIASLRAIPWIFAWMQNRLMLPAWLGAGQALSELMTDGKSGELAVMSREWPFFAARLSMLEMVFAKADPVLSSYYDQRLVTPDLRSIGDALRARLALDADVIRHLLGEETLLQNDPWGRESIGLRNIYTDPLNVLQVELLQRNRRGEDPDIEQALMVTIAGIAAGMRNTG